MNFNQIVHIELAPEGPKIIDGYWYEWVNGSWVNTGRKAEGDDAVDIHFNIQNITVYEENGVRDYTGTSFNFKASQGGWNLEYFNPMITAAGTYTAEVLESSGVSGFIMPANYTYGYTNVVIPAITELIGNYGYVVIRFTVISLSGIYQTIDKKITYNLQGKGDPGNGSAVIYRLSASKPPVPSAGIALPSGWSPSPNFQLDIDSVTTWNLEGNWYRSPQLANLGDTSYAQLSFTTHKKNQTVTLEIWGDGYSPYDYIYAGYLDSIVSTSSYVDRATGGQRKILVYEVINAGSHTIQFLWRKGISTKALSNAGYFSIVDVSSVWISVNTIIGGNYQTWSDPEIYINDTQYEERIYCLSKDVNPPVISDSDGYINEYIPKPYLLANFNGYFESYKVYSVGNVVEYNSDYYKVIKAVPGTYSDTPLNAEYFEILKKWTDDPSGVSDVYPYEFLAIRRKIDGIWGAFKTSVWRNMEKSESKPLILGWWNPDVSYAISDLGTPVVKVADATDAGFSVYELKVPSATSGLFVAEEWQLVESAEFIYMQDSYIERLQAAIVTADKINALETTSRVVRTAASGARTEIEAGTLKIFNDTDIFPNIIFGLKNGYAVMEYYDNNGVLLYDLGPTGMSTIDVVEEAWIDITGFIYLGIDFTTVLTTSTIKSKYKRPLNYSVETYYQYRSQRVGNSIADPANDGRIFVSKSIYANKIPAGVYCRRQNSAVFEFSNPYTQPARQHVDNESYITTSAYMGHSQALYNSYLANEGIINLSPFSAFWSEKIGIAPLE
ncbi:MAG: hypothetical protein AAGU18_10695 [Proteiniphilum sp.]